MPSSSTQAAQPPPRATSEARASPGHAVRKPDVAKSSPASASSGTSMPSTSLVVDSAPAPATVSSKCPPAPAASAAPLTDSDDLFARAQAMGLRLTREEYERTRAGVAAFLKAERLPSATNAASPAAPSPPALSTLGQRVPRHGSGHAESTSAESLPSAPAAHQQQRAIQQRSSGLSFFTAVKAPEPLPRKPRAKLDDISSIEERRRRKERQRRRREKLACGSDPEATPLSTASASPAIAASSSSGAFEPSMSPAIGLGVRRLDNASPFSVASTGRGQRSAPGSASASTPRSRSLSATAALSCSANLQAATADDHPASCSPDLQRLSSRAWLSPSGKLKLMPPHEAQPSEDKGDGGLLRHVEDPDDSGIVMASDSELNSPAQGPLLGDGFEVATRAGWGSRRRNDSEGSSAGAANTKTISDGMAKLGLLERVMKDKRSPRRLRAEAKDRARSSVANANGPSGQATEPVTEAATAPGASHVPAPRVSSVSSSGPAGLHPPLQLGENLRKATHSRNVSHARQLSQATKNVRWAPSIAASPINHERMTTRDHYEFFVHGITPGAATLSDICVEQDISPAASAQETMPWLFSSQGSPVQRRGTFVSDDLTVDLSSIIDGDLEDVSATNLFNPRRGLLFTGPALQQSPVQSRQASSSLNRFSANFSDVSLSQSPVRPLLAHMASSPARSILGSASRHRRGSGSFSSSLGRLPFASSPTVVRSRGAGVSAASTYAAAALETISPAALFGGGVGGGSGSSMVSAERQSHASAAVGPAEVVEILGSTLPVHSSVRPPRQDDEGDDADEEDSITHSPIAHRGRQPTGARLLLEEGGNARVVQVIETSVEGSTGLMPAFTPSSAQSDSRSQKRANKAKKTPSAEASTDGVSVSAPSMQTTSLPHEQHDGPSRQAAQDTASVPAPLSTSGRARSPTLFSPPNGDVSLLSWTRADGSEVVKLISEELQAAMDAGGDFQEPTPRYFVLPPGAGNTKAKPTHVSYAGLIGQAILTSSDQRLSLAEIYQWISSVHPFFERGDRGWQNSIRHNLSLNKSFIKVEREASIPGKGGWWAIKPGHDERFQNGLYSAAPQKLSEAGDSASAGKKKKKPAKPAPHMATVSAAPVVALSSGPGPADKAPAQTRKRHPTGDTESPQTSPSQRSPSRGHTSSGPRRKLHKGLKKPKLGALHSSDGIDHTEQTRLPLASVTNRQPPSYSHGTVFDSVTPSRSDRTPFLASSTHGGSQSGMPMLTDSASSPPSSPPATSDAMMPPPSSLGPSSMKKGKGNMTAGNYGGLGHETMYASSLAGYGGTNGQLFGGVTGFYPAQPSPLASRLRGVSASNASKGSPLRRQTIPVTAPGSPSKVAAPVSSMRDMATSNGAAASSSLAGALNVRGTTVQSQPLGQHSTPFGAFLSNPFAAPRGSPGSVLRGRGVGSGLSPARGSPVKMSGQAFSPNVAHQNMASMMSPAGAQLQMAMHSNTVGASPVPMDPASLNMSYAGLGMGYPASNLTPLRGTPGKGGFGGSLLGVSPSPTMRRFQQQQAGNGWLDDPFDYQGALQHELESMGAGGTAMMTGVDHGGQQGQAALVQPSQGAGNTAGGLLAMSGMAPGGWGTMNISPMRAGSLSWFGAQDNVSAVRGGPNSVVGNGTDNNGGGHMKTG
ncbi:unnamed protein product [Parajaminaea phylloscopi]